MTQEERVAMLCKRIGDDAFADFKIILRQAVQAAYEDAAQVAENMPVVAHMTTYPGQLDRPSFSYEAAKAIRFRAREVWPHGKKVTSNDLKRWKSEDDENDFVHGCSKD